MDRILYAVSTSTGKPEPITSTAGVLNINRPPTTTTANGVTFAISTVTGKPEALTSLNGSLNVSS